jgi:peroxiredoxin
MSNRLAAVLALNALFIVGCAKSPRTAEAAVKPDKDRKAAPAFSLKDANGTAVRLADYKGKVVLLDFWATWCGPCKIEIPWFIEFEQTLKDRGFAVLGVSMDEDGWAAVKPYIEQRKLNYRVLMGNDEVGQLYGGLDALPTTFLIDREGRIARVHVGLEVGKDEFKNEINSLLAAPRAALTPVGAPALFARAR